MATAKKKLVEVKEWNTGQIIKVECADCYTEEGSYACVRPVHAAYEYRGNSKPITKEVLATSIVAISNAVKKLYDSGLNRRAVVALTNFDGPDAAGAQPGDIALRVIGAGLAHEAGIHFPGVRHQAYQIVIIH